MIAAAPPLPQERSDIQPPPSSRLRLILGALLVCLVIGLSSRMYGHYLFDDSYFGFSYAKNLAYGNGFVFNPGEHYLGTSAPLVVPIYAFFYKYFGIAIETTAQLGSCLLLVVGALSLFALLSKNRGEVPAFFAALCFVTTPLMTMVVSHESLLYLCLGLASLWAMSRQRYLLSGMLIGVAVLCRMEAVMLGAACLAMVLWRREWRGALRYVLAASVVLLPWIVFATGYFGSPLSNTVKAKQLQVIYGNTPFLSGIFPWLELIYGKGWSVFVAGILAGSASTVLRRWNPEVVIMVVWVVLQSLIYVLLEPAFYHWFVAQFSIALALLVYGACRAVGDLRKPGRIAHAVLVGLAVALLLNQQVKAITSNQNREDAAPYYRLAHWIKANTKPTDKVAYLEIGMLKFYSERFIVDWLGLVTPGVLPKIQDGNFAWIIKHYKPEIYIQNDAFNAYLAIEQYDWFKRSYRLKDTVDIGYPNPFKIYELAHPERIGAKEDVYYAAQASDRIAGEITAQSPIETEVVLGPQAITALELKFATFQRKLTSHYRLDLLEGDTLLASLPFEASQVQDNVYKVFPGKIPAVRSSERRLRLRLSSPDAGQGNALTVWMGPKTPAVQRLSMADQPMDGSLCLRVYGPEMIASQASR